MKLSIISSSLREDSQSKRIANILKDRIKLSNNCDIFTVDLINENCPYWSSNKKDNDFYKNKSSISEIEKVIDAGDIFINKKFKISNYDTAYDIDTKSILIGIKLFKEIFYSIWLS